MRKLSTRASVIVALAVGASALTMDTSLAVGADQPSHATSAHARVADEEPGTDNSQEDPTGNSGDPTGNPNPGPLPPRNPSGNETTTEGEGTPFCPPVKDINLGVEGMHNHFNFPLVGGAVEGMPDVASDIPGICLNVDYPSFMSSSSDVPADLFSAGHTKGLSGQGDGNGNGSR